MVAKKDTESQKKVLIVEDHPIMRSGLAQLIGQEADLVVSGEAEDAHGAMEAIKKCEPDIAVVDISLKDSSGIELIKDIKIHWPKLPVLILSMHEESFYAERALRAGAMGYVAKAEVSTKVIAGIRQVLSGGVFVSEKISSQMLRKMAGAGKNIPAIFRCEAQSETPPVYQSAHHFFAPNNAATRGLGWHS